MSPSTPNFEGQTYGNFKVGHSITAYEHIQWHLGTALDSQQMHWLGFPADGDMPCPLGFKKFDACALHPAIWARPVPLGCAMTETLLSGPLSNPTLCHVLIQCVQNTLPKSIEDIWWDEQELKVTYIGLTPYSTAHTTSAKALGKLVWHMATGQAYQKNNLALRDLLPQPTSTEFIDGLTALMNTSEIKNTKALKQSLEALAISISKKPNRAMTRQNTQEIWDAQNSIHVSRAAGQPAFFIIGGLVTAAVVYLLAGLGFFPGNSNSDDIPSQPPRTQDSKPIQPAR